MKRHRRGVALAAVLLVGAAVGLVALLPQVGSDVDGSAGIPAAAFSLQDAEIIRLTTTGNAGLPAISPDGRYVAYVQDDGDDESLWIRQTATPSNVQIVAPRPGVRIGALTVTPDGNFVDYVAIEQSPQVAYVLWRVPFLGGPPRRLIDGVHSGVGWSPDGRQLAFVRMHGQLGDEGLDLVVADAEGRDERVLASTTSSGRRLFLARESRRVWHACRLVARRCRDRFERRRLPGRVLAGYAMFVKVADGSIHTLVRTPPGEMAWIDNTSLLYSRQTVQGGAAQLWRLSYPSGAESRLTNDLDGYPYHQRNRGRRELRNGSSRGASRSSGSATGVPATPEPFSREPAGEAYTVRSGMVLAWAGDRLRIHGPLGRCLSRSQRAPTAARRRISSHWPAAPARQRPRAPSSICRWRRVTLSYDLESGRGWPPSRDRSCRMSPCGRA